jgi:purine-binding chemotaxis protein CheW
MHAVALPATQPAPAGIPSAAVPAEPAAAPVHSAVAPAVPNEVLSFRLGAEEYGIDILCVQEIRSYEPCTRIAGAPPFVRGVVNLRGAIVPVIDLRVKFGLEHAALDGSTATIVTNVAQRVVGVVVDAVSDVVEIGRDQVQPPPQFATAADGAHLACIATLRQADRQRMLQIIDIDGLLRSADIGLLGDSGH